MIRNMIAALLCVAICCGAENPVWAEENAKTEQQKSDSNPTTVIATLLKKECTGGTQNATDEEFKARNKIPDDMQDLLLAWVDWSKTWRLLFYLFSISAVLFGALAGILTDGPAWYQRWKTGAALIATVVSGATATMSPQAEFKKFDAAFVILNTTKLAYLTNPSVSLCDVGKAAALGELSIHSAD